MKEFLKTLLLITQVKKRKKGVEIKSNNFTLYNFEKIIFWKYDVASIRKQFPASKKISCRDYVVYPEWILCPRMSRDKLAEAISFGIDRPGRLAPPSWLRELKTVASTVCRKASSRKLISDAHRDIRTYANNTKHKYSEFFRLVAIACLTPLSSTISRHKLPLETSFMPGFFWCHFICIRV